MCSQAINVKVHKSGSVPDLVIFEGNLDFHTQYRGGQKKGTMTSFAFELY